MKYITPEVLTKSFTCPHCGVLSNQEWWGADWHGFTTKISNSVDIFAAPIKVGRCQHCNANTLWIANKMFYPDNGNAPFPNPEMPENVKKLYAEAASIHLKSPRGASALLRLGIQVLCKELGEDGKNINNDIANLVKKGLPEIVQQSLDILRVTGNEAVHPGQIDTDNPEVVKQLFNLTNIIVEYMIALPNKVSGLYLSLPTEKIDAIKDRDK